MRWCEGLRLPSMFLEASRRASNGVGCNGGHRRHAKTVEVRRRHYNRTFTQSDCRANCMASNEGLRTPSKACSGLRRRGKGSKFIIVLLFDSESIEGCQLTSHAVGENTPCYFSLLDSERWSLSTAFNGLCMPSKAIGGRRIPSRSVVRTGHTAFEVKCNNLHKLRRWLLEIRRITIKNNVNLYQAV
jgi:hypothetical protein